MHILELVLEFHVLIVLRSLDLPTHKTDAFENNKIYYFQFFLIFNIWQMLWCVKKSIINPQNIKWVEKDSERKLKKNFLFRICTFEICITWMSMGSFTTEWNTSSSSIHVQRPFVAWICYYVRQKYFGLHSAPLPTIILSPRSLQIFCFVQISWTSSLPLQESNSKLVSCRVSGFVI